MLRRRLQKIGSILGLLAILMATLAPTISQALQTNGRVDALLSVYCSAQGASDPADNLTGDHSSPHITLSHLQACGYCNLFAHAPALPSAETVFAGTVWVFQHRSVTRFESLRRVAPLTSAQPRAPPVLS
ncbi:DUF2946 domain-containing protein [Paraburkholderia sp. GAS334]|uniref:DUF2946 domain-containing protein n=1 Tax=Paraburkholderia sp. GAS334 TaxID=3035131 RepID=UPI003D1A75E6